LSRDEVVIFTEPLLHPDYVQTGQVTLLSSALLARYDVTVVAPAISPGVRSLLRDVGIEPISLVPLFPSSRTGRFEVASYILAWGLEAGFELNRLLADRRLIGRHAFRISLAMTTSAACDIWWSQGRPVGPTLQMIGPSLAHKMRLAARLVSPICVPLDALHMRRKIRRAGRIYTNSRSLADWYIQSGVPVQGVIPSIGFKPADFFPSTTSPTRDYVVTYLGKETDKPALRGLISTGLPIRAFGAKSRNWVQGALPDPLPTNVEVLGKLTTRELRELYSNARFTAFPFTEEPFGLVPIESMACGTPVLTYGRQGPGETVLHDRTGWLVDTATQFANAARSIYSAEIPHEFAARSLQRAREFDFESVTGLWASLIRTAFTEDRAAEFDSPPGNRTGIEKDALPPLLPPVSVLRHQTSSHREPMSAPSRPARRQEA
jgi:Glycosyl transferases group 1